MQRKVDALPELNQLEDLKEKDGHEEHDIAWRGYVDDRNGKPLRSRDVAKARKAEIKTLKDMGVYKVVLRSEAVEKGKKIIGTRWLDVDKGSASCPDVRSRCVAKDFNTNAQDDLFAATPALEGVKSLISMTSSSADGWEPTERILVLDIKRAFLHAPVTREVFIELPEEARGGDKRAL